jgi:hypothetical protein
MSAEGCESGHRIGGRTARTLSILARRHQTYRAELVDQGHHRFGGRRVPGDTQSGENHIDDGVADADDVIVVNHTFSDGAARASRL